MKLKHLIVLSSILLVLQVNIVGLVIAQSTTFTISQGVYPHAPAYTFWREGSTYYAKNSYGAIPYSGTNILQVLQNTIGSNRHLYFSEGTFVFTGEIEINNTANLRLSGSGMATCFDINHDDRAMDIYNGENIIIENIRFDGTDKNAGAGVLIRESSNCIVRNCFVYNMYARAIAIIEGGCYNKVLNNHVHTTRATSVGETIVFGRQNHSLIEGNIVRLAMHGGITCDHCENCTITGNIVEDADGSNQGYGGIDLETTNRTTVSSNTIVGRSRGLRLSAHSCDNTLSSNTIDVEQRGIYVLDTGGASPFNKISDNTITARIGVCIEAESIGCSVTDNLIRLCQREGIIVKSNYTKVSSNIIQNINTDDNVNYGEGIQIGTGSINVIWVTVSDNTIYDNRTSSLTRYGIREMGGCDYTTMIGNVCLDATIVNIKVSGSNSKCNLCWNGTSEWVDAYP